MNRFLTRSAFAAAALVAALPARAVLDPAYISADARWVAHADLNALRTTTLGKEFIAMGEKAQLEITQGAVSLNIQKVLNTVGSVTAYGTNFSKDPNALDGTLLVQGTADLKKIAESLLLQGMIANPTTVSEVKDLPFPAYSLTDGQKMQVIVAFPPEPVILVSRSRPQIVRARELFRGGGASMAKAAASPLKGLLRNAENAYLFSASFTPPEEFFTEDVPQARILKMAAAGSLALGETDVNTFAHTELVATDASTADKLTKILQGMTAMFSMAESADQRLGEFLNAVNVTRQNNTVTLSMSYPTARIVAMVQNFHRMQTVQAAAPRPPARPTTAAIVGRAAAEWTAGEPTVEAAGADGLSWRTIENVSLKNGSTISLARTQNGGKPTRFDRVEIVQGSAAPLTFRGAMMRAARNNLAQFQFPGADGVYTLRVAYTEDPDGKTRYAVSVRDPQGNSESP